MKSEVFPIVSLLVLGLIYIGISAAVVVLLYKQNGKEFFTCSPFVAQALFELK